MNKLTKLIFKAFVGPFLLSFGLVIIFFVMLFVWKYIDDIMGKGIEWYYITELIVLKSAETVPIALPLAILISSTMTMGALAENYELAALKSSGLSLHKIMRPLMLLVLGLSLGSLLFTNFVTPTAAIKFKQILWDIIQKKPMMELKDGVFYNDLEGFSIRVKNKNETTGELNDVLIYDHRKPAKGNKTVIRARKGKTVKKPGSNKMFLELYDGVSYDEQEANNRKGRNHPLLESKFKKSVLTLDLSSFDFNETPEDRFNNMMSRLNMKELAQVRDSLGHLIQKKEDDLAGILHKSIKMNEDSLTLIYDQAPVQKQKFDDLSLTDQSRTLALAKSSVDNMRAHIKNKNGEITYHFKARNNAGIVFWEKIAYALSCLIFFYIGAPLGAIIKKGGLGLPIIFSILLYLTYHILNMIGRKMAKSYDLLPQEGLLIGCMVLFPIGVFLTSKAARDSVLFDKDLYLNFMKKLFRKKEIVIDENTSIMS
ncbi:MAG: LptF/LptG family permease [Bacteroidota bacterium]